MSGIGMLSGRIRVVAPSLLGVKHRRLVHFIHAFVQVTSEPDYHLRQFASHDGRSTGAEI